ncbi:hypothetical protein POM88_015321 [Heracleum sosnowskyi]|uniref:CG-1 domain-containing protein n=1 Tax=Heracleum sosnowskyi TaxID=360622 RepID=A0AAD8IL59_9APIA|nr:hypothetical protein POM88_015321 [Heracleum sosnowskyi]
MGFGAASFSDLWAFMPTSTKHGRRSSWQSRYVPVIYGEKGTQEHMTMAFPDPADFFKESSYRVSIVTMETALCLDLPHILEEANHRWMRTTEICEVLQSYKFFYFNPPVKPAV